MHRLLSLAAFLCFVGVTPAFAQAPWDEVGVRYESALAGHADLLDDREQTFSRYEQALDRVDAARSGGDEASRATAHANFQVVAFDLMDLELAVDRSTARVRALRAEYLAALEEGEEELLRRLSEDEVRSPASEAALFDEWRQLRARSLAAQADAIPEDAVALRPVPELTVDPRDGPVESLEKARFMEEQSRSYNSLIADLDTQVEALERQMQQRQSVQDLLRDVGRFGSDFLQGGPPGLSVPDPPGTDVDPSAVDPEDPGSALAQLPLNEWVELLRGARDLAVQYRDQTLAMARVFRDRAEGMQP